MVRVSILHPTFTWHTTPTVAEQQKRLEQRRETPKLRTLWPRWFRILVGRFHACLVHVSSTYCRWAGVRFSGQICDLPFGLLLKRSDGTRLEEVVAMQAARDAGLPVPFVVSYGEHPDTSHAPVSILMTRMPGRILFKELWEWFIPAEQEVLLGQLRSFLSTVRSWKQDKQLDAAESGIASPTICSVMGTSLRSYRVPNHTIGPCADVSAFDEPLIRWAYGEYTKKDLAEDYPGLIEQLHEFQKLPPKAIVFTHGDLAPHNLLVLPDGRISAFLDWEASGWYPGYWEYTTGIGLLKPDSWWPNIVRAVGGEQYMDYHIGDRARRLLAPDTMGF